MIQGRCPLCSKRFTIGKIDELPSFPFCSPRCRLIDLGRWIDGAYVIPGRPSTAEDESESPDEPVQDPDEEADAYN